jgi:hypothetical protein
MYQIYTIYLSRYRDWIMGWTTKESGSAVLLEARVIAVLESTHCLYRVVGARGRPFISIHCGSYPPVVVLN